MEASKINQRAVNTKNKVIKSQEKALNIFSNTKDKLQTAMKNSKVVEQINVLSELIMQISSQTNLLALNAAIEASNDLSSSSNELLNFVSEDVHSDYNTMLNVADEYSQDAEFVNNLVLEFSSTSEELLALLKEVIKTIEQVSIASNEGAEKLNEDVCKFII